MKVGRMEGKNELRKVERSYMRGGEEEGTDVRCSRHGKCSCHIDLYFSIILLLHHTVRLHAH